MKTLWILALAPTLAFAGECPQLAGSYKCSSHRSMTVAQGVDPRGVATYAIRGLLNGELRLTADGVTREENGAAINAQCGGGGALLVRMDHERGSLNFSFRKQGDDVIVKGMQDIRCVPAR